jgi:hypothetical protein
VTPLVTMLRYGLKRTLKRLLPWMSAAKRRSQQRAEYASCADTAGRRLGGTEGPLRVFAV